MITIFLTEKGRSAIKNYLKEMEDIIKVLSKLFLFGRLFNILG
jgi:hypothetical protein